MVDLKKVEEGILQKVEEKHIQLSAEIAEMKLSLQGLTNALTDTLKLKGSKRVLIKLNQNDDRDSSYQMPTRFSKVDFLVFNGTELTGWLFKSERFFLVDHTPENAKVDLASLQFTRKALKWHQSYLKIRRITGLPPWRIM